MCRVVQQRFPDEPVAAAQARRFVAETLDRWELESLVADIQLAVTELVTNAVLHARTPVLVTLCVANGSAEAAVTDRDLQVPRMLPHRLDLLGDLDAIPATATDDDDARHTGLHYGPSGSVAAGRGLIILDAISSSWGVTPRLDGKDVWARLPVPSGWPYRQDCVCGPGADRVTASGGPVQHVPGAWDD